MPKLCTVSVNGEKFSARRGQLLLDAALKQGLDIPHDCRSGHCGSCRAHVVQGRLLGGRGEETNIVRACQARIMSDVMIETESVPEILRTAGQVSALARLTPDVVEVIISPARPIHYLPGQYFQLHFRSFPVRCFSPTIALDAKEDGTIRLHIRRVSNGRVSSALGTAIKPGHRVKLDGPFGSAYLRKEMDNRLVLVAGGTGFAPIWSIATAALRDNPDREIVIVVGVRSLEDLYMTPALCWLARYPQVNIIPVTDAPQTVTSVIRTGRPTDYVPPLDERDIVYACGVPPMVDAAKRLAMAAGARCYADAFTAPEGDDGWLWSAKTWMAALRAKIPHYGMQKPGLSPGFYREAHS